MAKHDMGYRWSSTEMDGDWTTVINSENPPSLTIVEAVADHEDKDPTELDFKLYDYINPEALDIVAGDAKITFSAEQYEVEVVNSDVIRLQL